ncbi:MAG: 50S ribosomal protein L4 [Candidatus Komeilibacteria bacterium]|nr:50S ribosomal protein L4 [Candidatus Komeilibacteria bacterium]
MLKIYNQNGEVVKEKQVPESIFGVVVKPVVVKQAVVAQQANQRASIAHTKDRSEVSGGGKKPWKQKGTGRARHGSTRSPIWRHGGVTFGPRNTVNWSVKINTKARQAALRMVLSDKLTQGLITVVEGFTMTDYKTKNFKNILAALKLDGKKLMISLGKKDAKVLQAIANLPKVYPLAADSLNVVDLLKYPQWLVTAEGLETIIKQYVPKKVKKA